MTRHFMAFDPFAEMCAQCERQAEEWALVTGRSKYEFPPVGWCERPDPSQEFIHNLFRKMATAAHETREIIGEKFLGGPEISRGA